MYILTQYILEVGKKTIPRGKISYIGILVMYFFFNIHILHIIKRKYECLLFTKKRKSKGVLFHVLV